MIRAPARRSRLPTDSYAVVFERPMKDNSRIVCYCKYGISISEIEDDGFSFSTGTDCALATMLAGISYCKSASNVVSPVRGEFLDLEDSKLGRLTKANLLAYYDKVDSYKEDFSSSTFSILSYGVVFKASLLLLVDR